MITSDTKRTWLVSEAKRWVGVKEQSGDNKGQLVEMFQRAVDNKAAQESWCMAFTQWLIIAVDKLGAQVFMDTSFSPIFKSESCLETWNRSPERLRLKNPIVGGIAIWQFDNTSKGHCGIVTGMGMDNFYTIEGNTGTGAGVVREGDGIYTRTRTLNPVGSMKLLGFLSVWDVS